MLESLLNKYQHNTRYDKTITNSYIIPHSSLDSTIFFYRLDCLGGVPLVVFLYDVYGIEGIEQYKKIPINHCLHINNGIYPLTTTIIEEFCKHYIVALKNCTYIGCWNKGYIPELYLIEKYCYNKAVAKPYNSGHEGNTIWFNKNDWYEKLANKKILIISSHAESMRYQWVSNNLFRSHGKDIINEDTGIQLQFIKPPMSACGLKPHDSWLDSLNWLQKEIKNTIDSFDLSLVSCGSYSSYICNYLFTEYNSSVFYIGGALQLYFSIIGNRWINQPYINKYWKKLDPHEIPENSHTIENSCYF